MSLEQLRQNIDFFSEKKELTDEELGALITAAHYDIEAHKGTVPCTACRYCMEKCPQQLEIPRIIELFNEHIYSDGGFIGVMGVEAMEEGRRPSDCIGCGACAAVCPQQIDIPGTMSKFTELLANVE